ncbi:uncharacterized protein LOC129600982 [Paramacrobiotus metropolitanus]|uniref:uncharacterized protein LOC129600982 n=1 Tax=Paramacrobiotus metropolitanus TaxID=2943436 RepID=UPI0024464799|nr:uncharacterized protein LOC129600982 [Paramacrobiotus metropolitanus]
MIRSIVWCIVLFGAVFAQQQQAQKEGLSEPAPAESSLYGRYRSGGYGGNSYGHIDPRYFDRGDTPHFGLAGFPFGYERRYYGQNVVYDNSLAGFPLNYYNYQQDYNNNNYGGGYNAGYKGSSYKPQYRSSAAYSLPPKSYGSYPSLEYGAYLGHGKPSSNYYSLQYGY